MLVCEVLDSYLLGEWVLPTVAHAKQHLLKLNPVTQKYHVIPQSARLVVQLLETNLGLGIDGKVAGFDLSPFRSYRQTGSK